MTDTTTAVVEDTVRRLLDEEAIRTLLARYCQLCDARAGTSWVRDVFCEDAVDDHGLFGQVFTGWDELESMYEKSGPFLEATAHFITNVEISLDGDAATGQTYVQCFTWLNETAHLGNVRPADYVFVGVYHDTFRRTADGWRIQCRLMVRLGPGALGLGQAHPVYFAAYQDKPGA